jgi:hypothetical protein
VTKLLLTLKPRLHNGSGATISITSLAKWYNTQKVKSDIQAILQIAKDNGGSVSLADCVLATGKSTEEVRKMLNGLCTQELMAIDNHPDTGAIIYKIV